MGSLTVCTHYGGIHLDEVDQEWATHSQICQLPMLSLRLGKPFEIGHHKRWSLKWGAYRLVDNTHPGHVGSSYGLAH